jgi:hypothetical protein
VAALLSTANRSFSTQNQAIYYVVRLRTEEVMKRETLDLLRAYSQSAKPNPNARSWVTTPASSVLTCTLLLGRVLTGAAHGRVRIAGHCGKSGPLQWRHVEWANLTHQL